MTASDCKRKTCCNGRGADFGDGILDIRDRGLNYRVDYYNEGMARPPTDDWRTSCAFRESSRAFANNLDAHVQCT